MTRSLPVSAVCVHSVLVFKDRIWMHYQYIKILTVCVSVRLSVCNGSGMFVGRD